MPPVKTIKLLRNLIKAEAPAPEDWPWYPIEIKGHAATFKEALERLKVLRREAYAFTTDSETHGKLQADGITEFHKNRSKKQATVEQILSSGESLTSDSDEDIVPSSQPNSDIDSNGSSDEDNLVQTRKNKGQKTTKNANISQKVNISQKANYPKKANLSKKAELAKKPDLPKKPNRPKEANLTKEGNLPKESDRPREADLPKNATTSKHILDNIRQQAARNLHCRPDGDTIELEDNLEAQGGELEEVVKDFPRDTAFLYIALKKLTMEVKSVATELETLRSSIERSLKVKVDQMSIVNFVQKYAFHRLSTVAEYKTFDQRLADDAEYAKDLKTAMECLLDSDLQRTITRMMKRMFGRDLAMSCTAYRQSKEKFLLKGTKFYDLLFDFVGRFHKGSTGGLVTEKEFYHTLSSCLTNSKDWDGNRKTRQVQPPAVVIPEDPVQNIEIRENGNITFCAES